MTRISEAHVARPLTQATVGYRSEFAEVQWERRLADCVSVADLKAVLADWPALTDAAAVVAAMPDKEFARWERFRRQCRPNAKTPPAVEEWQRGYGALLIPQAFLDTNQLADHYKAPWGTAWIRYLELTKS